MAVANSLNPNASNTFVDADNLAPGMKVKRHKKALFPVSLHAMLRAAEQEGKQSIISWNPSGTMFRVHNPKQFVKTILARFSRQTKFKSFIRQLHLWCFQRVQSGLDTGSYYHVNFQRDRPELCSQMIRVKVKGIKDYKGTFDVVGTTSTSVNKNLDVVYHQGYDLCHDKEEGCTQSEVSWLPDELQPSHVEDHVVEDFFGPLAGFIPRTIEDMMAKRTTIDPDLVKGLFASKGFT